MKNIFIQNNNKIKIKCIKSFYDEKNSEHFKISIIKMTLFYIFWFNINTHKELILLNFQGLTIKIIYFQILKLQTIVLKFLLF